MSLHDKLLAVQTSLSVPKANVNSFGKYKYRKCEDILEAVKPLLKEHGLVLTLSDEIVMIGDRFYVKATATISMPGPEENERNSYVATATAYARESLDKKGMDESQITGAASSYARKYALNGLFCIDDTADADSTNTHEDKPPVKAPAKTFASGPQLRKIAELVQLMGYNLDAVYAKAEVQGTPTPEQAERIIKALEDALNKATPSAS